jgi:hypothetical protein
MATTRIRRFGVLSVGKIMGLVYALMGLLGGAIFALMSLFGAGLTAALQESGAPAFLGVLFGFGALIIFPIFYGMIGFLGGMLSAAIYNLVAGATGGIEMELTVPAPAGVPMGVPSYGQA